MINLTSSKRACVHACVVCSRLSADDACHVYFFTPRRLPFTSSADERARLFLVHTLITNQLSFSCRPAATTRDTLRANASRGPRISNRVVPTRAGTLAHLSSVPHPLLPSPSSITDRQEGARAPSISACPPTTCPLASPPPVRLLWARGEGGRGVETTHLP